LVTRGGCGHPRRRWALIARITHYSFGRIVIDGTEHTRDVIILPEKVVGNWWRKDGHSLVLDDLNDVFSELPNHLII
jgi:hypothetical protein